MPPILVLIHPLPSDFYSFLWKALGGGSTAEPISAAWLCSSISFFCPCAAVINGLEGRLYSIFYFLYLAGYGLTANSVYFGLHELLLAIVSFGLVPR